MRTIGLAGYLFIRTLRATLRLRHARVRNIESLPQYIIAFWHEHLLLMLHCRYRKPITVLISQSKDGEIIGRVMRLYGVDAARGSSTRGGQAALREIVSQAREGRNIVFTPDGPKGPRRVAKDGVAVAGRLTGLPIVPIAFAAKKKSSSGRGTGWSCRCRSAARYSFTAIRSSCRTEATSRSGARSSRSG